MTQRLNAHAMIPQFRAVGQMALARVGAFQYGGAPAPDNDLMPNFAYQFPPNGAPGPALLPPYAGCDPNQDPREMVRQAQRARIAQARASGALIPLSINSAVGADVAAGGTVTFTTSPTTPVCPVKLVIPRPSAPFFTISSIVIGRTEWNADGDPCHADVFATDAACCQLLQFQPLYPGQEVSMTVTNRDAAARAWFATLLVIPGMSGMGFIPDHGAGGCV